jgi:hypothetical protein
MGIFESLCWPNAGRLKSIGLFVASYGWLDISPGLRINVFVKLGHDQGHHFAG